MQSKFNVPVNFSERLSLSISRDGRTKQQISEAMGVKPPALSRWLAGSIPDRENARDLANTLNVDVDWLLNGVVKNGHAVREEPASYGSNGRVRRSPAASGDLLHACSVVLGNLEHLHTLEAFDAGARGFEDIWDRYKAARRGELDS